MSLPSSMTLQMTVALTAVRNEVQADERDVVYGEAVHRQTGSLDRGPRGNNQGSTRAAPGGTNCRGMRVPTDRGDQQSSDFGNQNGRTDCQRFRIAPDAALP